ncbi:MAG: hypothetical protein ACOC1G_09050 [Phycisphaeraceae bacterium]
MRESPLDIGQRREGFVDDYLLERFDGPARLRLHPPQREEVVFEVQPPLENACSGVYSVLVEHDGRYLLYYRGNYPLKGGGEDSRQQTSNVAISDDGIHFERPELDFYDMADGRKNNVIWQGNPSHNLVPFRDDNPDCDDDKRFKAVGGVGKDNLYALYSPDGLEWRLAQDEPLAVTGMFDSANVALWDPVIGRYRLFSRMGLPGRGRSIQSCESEDFLHWSEPTPHRYEAGAPVEQFYTNATALCPGAEHLLLSFPMRYVIERGTPVEDTSEMDYPGSGTPAMASVTDAVMMSSRDGVHWRRPFPEAWLRPGLDPRNWTHRNNTPAIGILPLREHEWSMYVSEHYGWPDNRLRRLSLRPWGFASIHADCRGGGATTRPFRFHGSELRLNFSTSAVGGVNVEIQDEHGWPIPGFGLGEMSTLYGDRLDHRVSWAGGGDVSSLAGQTVRIRFELKDADVFAIRFAN